MFNLPENLKIVRVQQVVAANAFTMSDYISCKNAHKVWFLINHAGATDTDITFALNEATDVAAGTNAAVTATFPIWEDADAGTSSDTLVRQTDAASLVITSKVAKRRTDGNMTANCHSAACAKASG